MADFLKTKKIQKRSGNNYSDINPAEHLKNKVVALYFSAHWCPPCRAFTPALKEFYEQLDGKSFEIIFVSFDRSESDLKQYVTEAHGNWCVIPFGDPLIQELSNKYGVNGIPCLVVIKANGDAVVQNARSDVQGANKSANELLNDWKKMVGL